MLTLAHAIHSSRTSSEQSHSPDATNNSKARAAIASMSTVFFALYCAACTGSTRSFEEQKAAVECKYLDLSITDLLKDHCMCRPIEMSPDGLTFVLISPKHGPFGVLTVRPNGVHVFSMDRSDSVFTSPETTTKHIIRVLQSIAHETPSVLITDAETVLG